MFRNDGVIEVTVTADERGDRDKAEKCRQHEVELYLQSKKAKYGKCLKSDVVTNTNPLKVKGVWLFEDLSKQKDLDKPVDLEVKSTKKRTPRRKEVDLDASNLE